VGFNNDPTRIGDIVNPQDRANGEAANCSDCGAAGVWHSTPTGRRIFLEPRAVPMERVPRGLRWGVAPDGTAAAANGPSRGHCRITHFDVCPSRPKPQGGLMLALWEKHRERQAVSGE
jgi:hypothetical protein